LYIIKSASLMQLCFFKASSIPYLINLQTKYYVKLIWQAFARGKSSKTTDCRELQEWVKWTICVIRHKFQRQFQVYSF